MPPYPTTRRRTERFPFSGKNVQKRYVGSTLSGTSTATGPVVTGTQTTVSEGHPFKPNKGFQGDVGGNFYTVRQYAVGLPARNISLNGVDVPSGQRHTYDGAAWPPLPFYDHRIFPPSAESDASRLNALGASAIAKCKPTNSVADASVFLAELLREGLPKLIGLEQLKHRTHAARGGASELLNYEFGVKPFLSDLRKFSEAVRQADAVIEQYMRDSGRIVRRRYEFPVETSRSETKIYTNVEAVTNPSSGLYSDPNMKFGDVVRVRETTRRVWFSGAFTYHLPIARTAKEKMELHASLAKKVFGLTLTPETIWNISPWTWAVDWVSNVGDVVSNISDAASDGLVLRYGYLMEHSIVKDTYTMTRSGLVGQPVIRPLSFVTETKQRVRANPYGFGVLWSGLSLRQLSILTALGITKGSRS